MSEYLLDSDTAIEFFRVFLSVVTVSELVFGAYRSRSPGPSLAVCRQFGPAFMILPLDQAAAERAAYVRAYLEDKGQRIGAYDVLIAGIALVHGHILATGNRKEFERVQDLPIEDWTERIAPLSH